MDGLGSWDFGWGEVLTERGGAVKLAFSRELAGSMEGQLGGR